MKKLRRFLAVIAVVLAASLCVSSESFQIISSAVGDDIRDSKIYMSEVKMFYGNNKDEARTQCEKEGYIFCPANLNEGAWGWDVFLGYKTTEDSGNAITDLTLLDMKYTHYEEIDYQKFLDDHVDDFRNQAAQMMVLVNELDRKVADGSPNALMSYDSLNLFYVDENKPHDAQENQLGYYLINNADITFFEKFIQRGNSMVLNRINDLLCRATSDYNKDGTTWVDRAKVSEAAIEYANGNSETKNMYDQSCQDPAKKLIKDIRSFRDTYKEAKTRFDKYGETLGYTELEGMTEENSMEKLRAAGSSCRFPEYTEALKTYALLDAFPYQKKGETVVNNASLLTDEETEKTESVTQTFTKDVTLAEYLLELADDETLEDHISTVYPIVKSMSPAQHVTLTLGGFSKLVEGLYQSNDYPSKRSEAINKAMQKLKDSGCKDGRLYIWTGIDKSLYDKKVVETDARKEASASGIDLQNSLAEAARKENDTLTQILELVDLCTMGYGGIMMIANAIIGTTFWTIGMNVITSAGVNLAAGALGGAVAGYVLGGFLCALQVINIICVVVGFVLLIYNILQWTGMFSAEPGYADFTDIPDVIFDARQSTNCTYSVRYDSLHSNYKEYRAIEKQREEAEGYYTYDIAKGMSDDHADLSGFHPTIDRWVAMFYSKSPAAGNPIELKEGMEPLVTRRDPQVPDGYHPLTLITGSAAANVNDAKVDGDTNSKPLYAFILGKNNGKTSGNIVEDDGTYITKVRFSHSAKQDDAINALKKANYQYYDVNLTPYDGYTYLGYQLGSAANALTDIRLANNGANTIAFGDANYGKMGLDGGETTPDGMALYATTSKAAGTPIVSVSIKYKRQEPGSGFEPVCLFSGGNAVDIGSKWKDNLISSGSDNDTGYFLVNGSNSIKSYETTTKSYSYEYMSQEDPVNGIYIYFQPKEQFKSTDENGNPTQRYISGFSYFLAGDKETDKDNNKYGTNYEFMQTFAKENGFELLKDSKGEAFRVMSDEAGEMTHATKWRDVGGYPVDTYNFDQVHSVSNNIVVADGDGGILGGFRPTTTNLNKWYTREGTKMIYHTAMYFGVSYTYNPYRAITGISGLITPYTERNDQIKFTGMKTPAGSFLAANVSIQGCPITSAGITAGYYNPLTMVFPLYTNYEAKQHSDLSWTTDKDMEVLSHYLMTSGPREGVFPLKEEDIAFSMQENPEKMEGYVPLCDLRTPGDYNHPMNLALDTTNKGSKYLYLYLKAGAGGRVENDIAAPQTNVYTKKDYVAAIFCGVGKTPEAAIANLYSNAVTMWPNIAAGHKDISAHPMVTEFDEIIPVDLSSEHPWYDLHLNDTNIKSLKNGVWVRGNEMAYYRWEGHDFEEKKTIDEYEKDWKCAYIGVVRTSKSSNKEEAAYGVLKYYSDSDTAPGTLNCEGTECYRAGGPVNSKEGKYFLYYTTNKGTASYQAPVTSIDISDEIFINGYNTSFTVSESDRTNNKLPAYGKLRMRTDEYKYIHLGYKRKDLPYYEALYLGVGDTKEEAFVDMIGTTNAYAAVDVNCNYNSFSKKWIVIGYRRTSNKRNAIRDIFLYQGEKPYKDENDDNKNTEQIRIQGCYTAKGSGKNMTFSEIKDGVKYKLVKHNLKSGAEVLSLNEGNGEGTGLYLYYTTTAFYRDKGAEYEVTPITNICFAYGDISPRHATTQDQARIFERSYYGSAQFNIEDYTDPVWECVLGVSGSQKNWTPTGDGASRFSLNQGVRPGMNGNGWEAYDNRVYMYVDRAETGAKTAYQVRKNCVLPEFGYYSPTSTFGYIKQVA